MVVKGCCEKISGCVRVLCKNFWCVQKFLEVWGCCAEITGVRLVLCKTFRWCWGAVLKFLEVVGGVCGVWVVLCKIYVEVCSVVGVGAV